MILGFAETALRIQGYQPTISDSMDLWAYHRRRVYEDSGRSVVLLGASRIQTGFAPLAFRERFGNHRLTQLAIPGTSPLATLHDLADDERFYGTVICSMTAFAIPEKLERAHSQKAYTAHYREQVEYREVEKELESGRLEESLVLAGAPFRLKSVLRRIFSGSNAAPPDFLTTRFDRSQAADYQKVNLAEHRRERVGRIRQFYRTYVPTEPDVQEWIQDAQGLKPYIERIKNRGGSVVFVRFPSSGEHWALCESHFPKTRFWDRLSELTGATTIHFKDVPQLAKFDCPDSSHLDVRDAYSFTNALIDECVRRKILNEP